MVLAVGDFVLVSEAGGPRARLEESRVFGAVFKWPQMGSWVQILGDTLPVNHLGEKVLVETVFIFTPCWRCLS